MKKSLKPYDVIYTYDGMIKHRVILAYSRCHAVQVLIRHYADYVVKSADCLGNFVVEQIPHLR